MYATAGKKVDCMLTETKKACYMEENHAYTEKIILVHELVKQTKFMPIQNHPPLLRSQMVHRLEGGKQSTWVSVIFQGL